MQSLAGQEALHGTLPNDLSTAKIIGLEDEHSVASGDNNYLSTKSQ